MKQSQKAPKRRQYVATIGLAGILIAGIVMTDSSAARATQAIPDPGAASARGPVFDVEALLLARKMAWAQDRVDRPWLWR